MELTIPCCIYFSSFSFLFCTFFSRSYHFLVLKKSRLRLLTGRSDLQFYRMQVRSRRRTKFKPVDTVCLFSPNTCSSNRAFHLTVFEYWILDHPPIPQNLLRTRNRENPFPISTSHVPPFENHRPFEMFNVPLKYVNSLANLPLHRPSNNPFFPPLLLIVQRDFEIETALSVVPFYRRGNVENSRRIERGEQWW